MVVVEVVHGKGRKARESGRIIAGGQATERKAGDLCAGKEGEAGEAVVKPAGTEWRR
nr:unnamed protein product [Digitaria exilis]